MNLLMSPVRLMRLKFLQFLCCVAYLPILLSYTSKFLSHSFNQFPVYSNLGSEITMQSSHLSSLKSGSWVKFISGASNQDLPFIRNMCYIYTLAGVDCIDLSADPAVVMVANEGVQEAMLRNNILQKPLIMISVNDDDDPHFRKAVFDKNKCPPTCLRPCEKVCPAWAIPPLPKIEGGTSSEGDNFLKTETIAGSTSLGVLADRCYGCGRCVPICPLGLIETESYTVSREAIKDLFISRLVDAIEIHTLQHHESSFTDLWNSIGDEILNNAKVLSISFPNMGESTIPYLNTLQTSIKSRESWSTFKGVQIWQSDGRPMSGDIGRGTAHKSSNLASYVLGEFKKQKALYENDAQIGAEQNIDITGGQHFVQLAGGTNDYSAKTAEQEGLLGATGFGGFAFGGYARRSIGEILHDLEERCPGGSIEDHPLVLEKCLDFANNLVSSVKRMSS